MAHSVNSVLLSCLCKTRLSLLNKATLKSPLVNQARFRKRWNKTVFMDLYRRRIEQGPEPERHRSEWLNWNYEAEIFAFGKRLGENFESTTLKTAFTHRSYVEKEKDARMELELDDQQTVFDIQHNSSLAQKGEETMTSYIRAYLRHSYPALPEEGICAVCDYLLSEDMLSYVGSNLGIKDLILCAEFPPSNETLSQTFKAIIGGLADDQGNERCHLFIQDFIITQLVGKDINEMWQIVNPMGVLQAIVTKQGGHDVESRLLYETGTNTILSTYMVGVYSDRQLLGKGYGETVATAEEMAARDALKRLFGTTNNQPALPFGKQGHQMKIDLNNVNPSIKDFMHHNQLQ